MTGTNYRLDEDQVRYLRGLEERIAQLESSNLSEVPVGALVDYAAQARSPRWSDTRREAVGSNWDFWYNLNDFNSGGMVEDASLDPAKRGVLAASVPSALPLQGQPGGLSSDGGYSMYFPGVSASRIELPLLLSTPRQWSMEAIFKPEVVPQKSCIMQIGSGNGFGLYIGDSAGNSGFNLIMRIVGQEWINTGVELKGNQWYHAIIVSNESEKKLYWYVSTFEEPSKRFSIIEGNGAHAQVSTPTTSSKLGEASSSYFFKGWIEEVSTYNQQIPANKALQSVQDRLRTSLEPAPPFGFLLADGTAVSRSKYARLFRVLGTSEGAGDLATTFNLPDIDPSRMLIRV